MGYDSTSTANGDVGKAREGLLNKINKLDLDEDAEFTKQADELAKFQRNMGLDFQQQIAEEAQTALQFQRRKTQL